MIGTIQDHSFVSQSVDIRCIKYRPRIIDFKIERGLVVHDDEEKVRPLSAGKAMAKKAGNG